jgi:hypothetical protein
MKITELWNLFLLVVILTPLIAIVSVYSFKYHVALYETSREEVDLFLNGLSYPLKLFFSWNKSGMYYDRPEYTPERIAGPLNTQRLFVIVLPFLFIPVSIIVIIRLLPTGNPVIVRYLLILIFLPYFMLRAWHFGKNIKSVK